LDEIPTLIGNPDLLVATYKISNGKIEKSYYISKMQQNEIEVGESNFINGVLAELLKNSQ
jgi:hypothetical protein